MYRKSWMYYRDVVIVWTPFILLLLSASLALKNPVYWSAVLLILFIRNPVRKAFYSAHPPRRIKWVEETALRLREISFKSRDGVTLSGRFLPGKNKATILLVHGLGQSTQDMLIYAEILASQGYGIFLIDLRAHGSSEGDTSTNGLREADDIAGAVDLLLHRIDVDGRRIGALGISLGAQAVLRGALKTENIRALVLEGLGPSTIDDYGNRPPSLMRWLSYPGSWLYHKLYEFMCGGKQPGVLQVIGKIAPQSIFLIAGGSQNIYFNRLFYQAAGEPKELWELPEANYGAVILSDSDAYIQRVTEFFNRELLSEHAAEAVR